MTSRGKAKNDLIQRIRFRRVQRIERNGTKRDETGQDRTEQDRTGQNRTAENRINNKESNDNGVSRKNREVERRGENKSNGTVGRAPAPRTQ